MQSHQRIRNSHPPSAGGELVVGYENTTPSGFALVGPTRINQIQRILPLPVIVNLLDMQDDSPSVSVLGRISGAVLFQQPRVSVLAISPPQEGN